MNYSLTQSPRSLYLHWPFCPYKCHFCPFVAFAGKDSFMPRYHRALMQEIKTFAHHAGKLSIDTIYIGGGTPSTYPDDLLLDMVGILNTHFMLSASVEFSIEVNPGTVRTEQLPLWNSLGINRLSIGVQSLNDNVLKNLNRHQASQDVTDLITKAYPIIPNLSIDLIIGLPGISDAEWKELLFRVVDWPITHISVYFLTVHEGTALYFRVKKNDLTLPIDESVVSLYCWTVDFLKVHGFDQYEISNFARNGLRSRHNQVYWSRKPYKAFGVGACSFDGVARYQNTPHLVEYMERIEREEDPVFSEEKLTHEQLVLETLMLGLRQARGISKGELLTYTAATSKNIGGLLDDLVTAGYVEWYEEFVRLTPLGLSVENEIVVRLLS